MHHCSVLENRWENGRENGEETKGVACGGGEHRLTKQRSVTIGVVRKQGYHNMSTVDAHVDETCALIQRRYNIINKKVKLPFIKMDKN